MGTHNTWCEGVCEPCAGDVVFFLSFYPGGLSLVG